MQKLVEKRMNRAQYLLHYSVENELNVIRLALYYASTVLDECGGYAERRTNIQAPTYACYLMVDAFSARLYEAFCRTCDDAKAFAATLQDASLVWLEASRVLNGGEYRGIDALNFYRPVFNRWRDLLIDELHDELNPENPFYRYPDLLYGVGYRNEAECGASP